MVDDLWNGIEPRTIIWGKEKGKLRYAGQMNARKYCSREVVNIDRVLIALPFSTSGPFII